MDSKLLFFLIEEAAELPRPPPSSTFHQDGVIKSAWHHIQKDKRISGQKKTSDVLTGGPTTAFQESDID